MFVWHSWLFWYHGNKWIHEKNEVSVEWVSKQAMIKQEEYEKNNTDSPGVKVVDKARWLKPPYPFYKLNVDAALRPNGVA